MDPSRFRQPMSGDEVDVEETSDDEDATNDVEEIDPLTSATSRAENAERELAYRTAELANVQRRLAGERADLIAYGSAGLARRMTGVLEDLERAMAAFDGNSADALQAGFDLVLKKLRSELESEGVVRIETVGKAFDPTLHEALMMVPPNAENPPGTIVAETEGGWKMKARVLRPARVVVASEHTSASAVDE